MWGGWPYLSPDTAVGLARTRVYMPTVEYGKWNILTYKLHRLILNVKWFFLLNMMYSSSVTR